MLAEVHRVLRTLPESLGVLERGIVPRSRQLVAVYGGSAFSTATQNASERPVVNAVAHWLEPRLEHIEALPRQLIHGDWTPANVKLFTPGWGVLDWEFARVDPVVMDVAHSCSTILMWSGLTRPARHIESLLGRYAVHSGHELSLESAQTAMALYWLHNYDHWRARQALAGGFERVVERQPERLLAVGKFVGAL
jgi:Ser/Thr protein kinase RdoA (MazF antagonist)